MHAFVQVKIGDFRGYQAEKLDFLKRNLEHYLRKIQVKIREKLQNV